MGYNFKSFWTSIYIHYKEHTLSGNSSLQILEQERKSFPAPQLFSSTMTSIIKANPYIYLFLKEGFSQRRVQDTRKVYCVAF